VNRTDDQGTFWDTLLDVGCALYSAWQVVTNPSPDNWLALGADVACIVVPFASGGGAAVRATAKYGDDVLAAAKTGDNVADAGISLNRIENAGNVAYDAGQHTNNNLNLEAETFLPDEFYSKNVPLLGTPCSHYTHVKYNNKTKEFEKSTVYYNSNAQQSLRIDWTNHGRNDYGNPHVHIRIFDAANVDGRKVRLD